MHRICKKAGASRVSEAAAKALAKELDGIGVKIAKEAIQIKFTAKVPVRFVTDQSPVIGRVPDKLEHLYDLVGIITYLAGAAFAPERVYPWLQGLSALIVLPVPVSLT